MDQGVPISHWKHLLLVSLVNSAGEFKLLIYSLFFIFTGFFYTLTEPSTDHQFDFVFQAIICKNYLDPLSLATWVSFLSTMQSFILALIIETNSNAWIIKSVSQLLSCLFVVNFIKIWIMRTKNLLYIANITYILTIINTQGIFGSGVTFYLVSWVIASRGPVFSAMFAPLSLVITTILSALLLQENVYVGRSVLTKSSPEILKSH